MGFECVVERDTARFLRRVDQQEIQEEFEACIEDRVYFDVYDTLLDKINIERGIDLMEEILIEADWREICYHILHAYQNNHFSSDHWRGFLKPLINKKIKDQTKIEIEKEERAIREDIELRDY